MRLIALGMVALAGAIVTASTMFNTLSTRAGEVAKIADSGLWILWISLIAILWDAVAAWIRKPLP